MLNAEETCFLNAHRNTATKKERAQLLKFHLRHCPDLRTNQYAKTVRRMKCIVFSHAESCKQDTVLGFEMCPSYGHSGIANRVSHLVPSHISDSVHVFLP